MKILLLMLLSAETTAPKSKEVIATGSLATNFDWNEDLIKHSIVKNGYIIQTELYRQTESQVRTDLNTILTASGDVDSATVEITDFTEIPTTTSSTTATSSTTNTSATNTTTTTTPSSKARVNFKAVLGVPDTMTADEIDTSVTDAVKAADSTQFGSFDSFADFEVTVIEQAKEPNTEPEEESETVTLTRSYGNTPNDVLLQKTVEPPNRKWKHLSQLEDGKILIYWSGRVRFEPNSQYF